MRYKPEEIDFLKKNIGKKSLKEIADDMNRSYKGLQSKAQILGIAPSREDVRKIYSACAQSRRTWSEEDIKFLKDNYIKLTGRQLAAHFNKSYKAVLSKAKVLKLRLPEGVRNERAREAARRWTPEMEEKVRELFKTKTRTEIAAIMNLTEQQVHNRCHHLGLKLSEEERARRNRKFLSKGWGWNKGLKGLKNNSSTKFKKGQPSHNHKTKGTIIKLTDKRTGRAYLKIKIEEPNKWIELHRYLWIRRHGEIPKGMMIVFKNGNSLDCRLGNLKMISMGDNVRRNANRELIKQHSKNLSDNYVAGMLWRGITRKERRELIKQYPELVDLKRNQLLLRRQINEAAQ